MSYTTFNNISAISWWLVLLVDEIGVPGENNPPATSHFNTYFIALCFIEYTSPWAGFEPTTLVVIYTDYIDSGKSNCHTITTMTAPILIKKIFYSICSRWNYLWTKRKNSINCTVKLLRHIFNLYVICHHLVSNLKGYCLLKS